MCVRGFGPPVLAIIRACHRLARRSEQTTALGILQELAGFPTVGLPFSADGDRVAYRSPPPRLGEHSAEILAEADYSDAEIGELAAAGVTRLEGSQ